jgi:hypothetical protein
MNEPESTTTNEELAELRREMTDWAMGIRCVFTALVALPLCYLTKLLTLTPRLEVIFEDMLGSKDKLPAGTLVAGVSVYFIFTLKKARHVWVATLVCLGFLLFSFQTVIQLLVDPLIQVIANLSGGGEVL